MPRSLRPFLIALTLLIGGLFLSSPAALAAPQINNQINYQARLMDSSGFPVADGNYSVIFSLYDASTAGNRLWTAAGTLVTPTAITVNVQNGLFTVLLGDTGQNTLDTVNWNSDQLYLGVTINADAEMLPRKRFASAPQAFNARQLQGMYASSTASGGQTLFTLNQTESSAATGTRSTLDVRSNGTSNANDFLMRGINDTNTVVFSINRQGSVTSTNVFVSGLTSSTNLNANIASFATATVAGQGICLSNGQFCSTGSTPEADTLQTVSNRGSFTTTTLTLFGGLTASNISATGTLNVTGASTLNGLTFTNATGTNVTSTNVFGVNGAFTNLSVNSLGVVGITWTNATGTNTTSTNLFASNLLFSNATGGTLLATTVSTTNLTVTGQLVCLADGTNCPSGTSPNLQTVTNAGNTTTNAIQFAGGTSTGSFVFSATTTVNGALISLSVTTTDLFANSASFATATVSGQAVCLANGIGCPTGTVLNDTLQSVTARGSFTTTTAQFFGGFVAASSSVTGTLNVAGSANLLQNAYVGTSSYSGGLNSLFATNGNDLFVAGNIGSVSSVFTNGEFVVGSSSTHYYDGGIRTSSDLFDISTSATTAGAITLYVSSTPLAIFDFQGTDITTGFKPNGAGNTSVLRGGNARVGSAESGGGVQLRGGIPDGVGDGGGITLDGASGAGTGGGGAIILTGGAAPNGGLAGGVSIVGGNSFSTGTPGSITLQPGFDSDSLQSGHIDITSLYANSSPVTLRFLEAPNNGTNYIALRAPSSALANTVFTLPFADGASSTVIGTNGSGSLTFVSVCLSDGTNCSGGSGSETLQSVTARGSFTTTTAQFFGGFVAASSSVTGTLNVAGILNVTGTTHITLTSTSSPITIQGPVLDADDSARALTYQTTGTEGIVLGHLNFFGSMDASYLSFTKDVGNSLNATGATMSYLNEANQLSLQVTGGAGFNGSMFQLTDLDHELFGFGADAAATIRKYSDATTSSIMHLWNLGSNQGSVTLNVGADDPNVALIEGVSGSIYFRSSASASGTFAYLKTSSTNSMSWIGLATVDMLGGSGTSSGPEADTLQTVTNRGSFTTTTSQFFGGIVAASSSVTGTLNVMGNARIGAPTTTLNSAFVQDGNDLYVEGNIGTASSIYTNGELVLGPSSTHIGDGYLRRLDGMQELFSPVNTGFLMQSTGGFVLQGAPDTVNAFSGSIGLYAGDGTSTLVSGSEVNLVGGQGYGNGFGGAVSITGGGSGTSTFSAGGGVIIAGGFATGNGGGGGVTITGSDTFGTGIAGSVGITAGSAFGGGNAGGLSLTAGASFGTANGGDITLQPGISIGGYTGNLVLQSGFGFAPPEFRLNEDQLFGSNYVGFRAPTSVTSDSVWILPASDGTSGQVLSTDGAGNLSFINAGGGGGGDSNWTYSAASNTYLTVTSTANVVIGGTSTTINGAPLFTMDGNDLLVTGSIGTDRIFATGRVDAPYLNRWFTSPLLTQTIYKGGRADVPVGDEPHGVVFDGSHIWAANYSDPLGTISKIDPLTSTVVATTTVGTEGVDGMAFDGKYIWAAQSQGVSNNLHKINPITNQVVATVPLSGTFLFAQGVAFDGTYIWVSHTGSFPSSSIVSKVDPNTNTVVDEIPVGVSPYGLAYDGSYMWVANFDSGSVSKIDTITNQVVATTTGLLSPAGMVFDGSHIWVSSAFSDIVYKINPATAAVVATVGLDASVNAQNLTFDGTYIWVAQLATTTIVKIDPRINSIVERIPIAGASRSIAVDGSHAWVTNSLFSDFVTKIPYGVGNGAASNLNVGSLVVNATTGSATGTSNYAVTIAYASATTFGGLCINDISTGATCPTTGIGASIVADGPIIANRFDLAEMYSVTGTHEAGDVLVLDASSTATVKTSSGTAYDSKVIGIASTDPGFILGWNSGAKVALTGRVPVKISMNNGPIHVGDSLVSSDVPGYAMKATRPGMVLGYALEDASATGTVQVFVSVGFWAGMAFGEDGSIKVDDDGNVSVMNDLYIGGRLFPSLKGGGIQNDWYLFIDDTDPTSTYLSTNADGFQSMDTYDFAERYYSPDQLEPGDLVVVSDNGRTHVQRSLNEDDMLLGIVSTRPAFIAGRPATSTYPIALSGRVPTKVSSMNGAIKAGDPLAPTSIPGVAAKAVRSGPVVGLALEDFDGAEISKIEVFVNPNYWVNEQEVAEEEDPEVSSEIVVSQGKQGFATISAGAKKVRIEFPSLNAYPNVQVTPRGSTGGAWWTDGYSDSGFEIIMQETQDHDVVFAWRVEATTGGDVMRMSDGTYATVDPLTGMPTDWVTTSTEPIVDEPESSEPTSTESIIEIPEETPELEEEFISEEEMPTVSSTSTETP
jgi:YVTN family beta-propeller protein